MLPALVLLTAVSGLVDAASYLGLGHVFTANMTGNVVILGFSAAGAPGFSAVACLVSLTAFLAGAAATGRLTRSGTNTWLFGAVACEIVLVGVAARGGVTPRVGRRGASVVTMFTCALVGALLYLHHGTGWALVGATAVSVGAGALLLARRSSDT